VLRLQDGRHAAGHGGCEAPLEGRAACAQRPARTSSQPQALPERRARGPRLLRAPSAACVLCCPRRPLHLPDAVWRVGHRSRRLLHRES
jgi:hypothetical protein